MAEVSEREPDLVGNDGSKWYMDRDGSDYASRADKYGISLLNTTVWLVQHLNDAWSVALIQESKNIYEVAADERAVQKIGQEIDRLKAMRKAGR